MRPRPNFSDKIIPPLLRRRTGGIRIRYLDTINACVIIRRDPRGNRRVIERKGYTCPRFPDRVANLGGKVYKSYTVRGKKNDTFLGVSYTERSKRSGRHVEGVDRKAA